MARPEEDVAPSAGAGGLDTTCTMKSSSATSQAPDDKREQHTETTRHSQTPRSEAEAQRSYPRPNLMRSSPASSPDSERGIQPGGDSEPQNSGLGGLQRGGKQVQIGGFDGVGDSHPRPEIMRVVSGTEEERLVKLKEAVNAKMMLQQRKRSSIGAKRPTPIKEEDSAAISPSLNDAFASPGDTIQPLSTVSTESTESAKTVRASAPPTPADGRPLRTPSYPFPYVPGTPRTWSSSFHQPFTTLSPTVTARYGDNETPGTTTSDLMSGDSTPAGGAFDFAPPAQGYRGTEDPRFPTPNLYDAVLQLNTEPGLEPWWAAVTNIMHDHYKAERVTLIMPLDPTDLENVPWGQRATFSMNGPEEFVPHGVVEEQTAHLHRLDIRSSVPSAESQKTFSMQRLHPERLRPNLQARHSYAGQLSGRDAQTMMAGASPGTRPKGPLRTTTHAPGMYPNPRQMAQRMSSATSVIPGQSTLSDPDFSSVAGGIDAGPYAEVFPALRSLDHEARPLIEAGGVSRILERGKAVTVTRDYTAEAAGIGSSLDDTSLPQEGGAEHVATSEPRPSAAQMFGNYRNAFSSDNLFSPARDYEEYEQCPTSPWTQSPAPSPAIQAEEDSNPFFASEEQQVEDSFNPLPGTDRDYSQIGQVEAIGVDCASTVIHIPLVHPSLSQPMQSLRMRHSQAHPGMPQRSNTLDQERKAPVAILSVLSPTVPYPPNLTHSLKLLGPHLATSFANARQFSAAHPQAISIRHRRTVSGNRAAIAPMTIEPTSLEDIMDAELEEPMDAVSGSMTSPSDYSGRSRHSPASSIAGTPGWDPASHGWTSSKSTVATPALTGSEMVDNYFEARKRSSQRGSSVTNAPEFSTPAKAAMRQSSQDRKQSARKKSPPRKEELRNLQGDAGLRVSVSAKDEKSPMRNTSEHSPMRNAEAMSGSPRPGIRHTVSHFVDENTAEAARKHSLLHSYGGDLENSIANPLESAQYAAGHLRRGSQHDDMPPPSERLLRTIIDSVPVQIFTAKPDTGTLSWVNSKFLIYRGQEPRQVLSQPWQAIHPDDRTEFMASWHRSLRTAQQLQQKVRLERFDGSFRWFYVRAAPLKDKRQKIVHWIGTMMDFHEQHLAESNAARQQDTAASEAKYRALANSSPQIVFAVNRKKGIIFCNSQWLHYSGQTELQAQGLGFIDCVHPDDLVKCNLPSFDDESGEPTNVPMTVPPELNRANTTSVASSSGSSETERGVHSSESSSPASAMPQRKLSELAHTGILKVSRDLDGKAFYSTEVRLKSKEGDYRWHLVRVLLAEPLGQKANEEETWYGTCTDINDHKTLERDLKETMDEKSRFLSNMSHEIRTPLNGIMGMVNFLIDSSLSSEQMEHVNIIRASTEGLRGLINDILDLSKAEAGMIQLNYDWLYIRALIEEVNDLTSAMAIDKGLELNYIVEEDVPAQVKGDRFRIRQILLNVIGNAIKFTQQGEVFVRCSVMPNGEHDIGRNEKLIKFEVIDTGRGFNDKEAEHLFKRFSQIDGSSTRQHGGTGLGLVISRQLAQLHGGDMSAKGVPDKGATFSFYVQTSLPSKHDVPPAAPPPTPGPGAAMPILSSTPGIPDTPTPIAKLTKTQSVPERATPQARPSPGLPRFHHEYSQSPGVRDSPGASSVGSDSSQSIARTDSLQSERSSASSYLSNTAFASPALSLSLPENVEVSKRSNSASMTEPPAPGSLNVLTPGGSLTPPMYSIMVICPLQYSREATVRHIEQTLPKDIPHQITAQEDLHECQNILGGAEPVLFTHIVVFLPDVDEVVELLEQIMTSPRHSSTCIVIITDLAQRKKILEHAPKYDYDALVKDQRVHFVFKPLKPSRFAFIFDPRKEREMSTDRNQDSAQAVAVSQKQVFEDLKNRLGNKDKRVLLVEDNRVNQMVILKFLSKVSIQVDTALDGVQCVEKVFSNPPNHYSIILCDLHMPNKDGYQTCREIRKWEKKYKIPSEQCLPIIALSANVLGDVYQKCAEAGFNSYMTKPVDFKELSQVLVRCMDPDEKGRPQEFMRRKAPGHR
ncbi:hypothetical protein LTR62_001417 [Meristemomyces frigidus]|uniref:histidine kinase n=1 Tax=Meristemomyces frigidus TaxID=1508187 RepID=A0AAN7YBL4_9PEZI|nr:hypothetical protein LTR62_001417 [Meristemomyces frigidus]